MDGFETDRARLLDQRIGTGIAKVVFTVADGFVGHDDALIAHGTDIALFQGSHDRAVQMSPEECSCLQRCDERYQCPERFVECVPDQFAFGLGVFENAKGRRVLVNCRETGDAFDEIEILAAVQKDEKIQDDERSVDELQWQQSTIVKNEFVVSVGHD